MGKGRTQQKVAVAMHEENVKPLGGGLENLRAAGFKTGALLRGAGRAVEHVVTDPDFKQITQDEHGISRCGLHERLPDAESGRLAGLQVQVGDEVNGVPVRWRLQHRPRRHNGVRRDPGRCGGHMSECHGLVDDHVLNGNVIVVAPAGGLDRLDLVDHLGAVNDFAEHGVAPALG